MEIKVDAEETLGAREAGGGLGGRQIVAEQAGNSREERKGAEAGREHATFHGGSIRNRRQLGRAMRCLFL